MVMNGPGPGSVYRIISMAQLNNEILSVILLANTEYTKCIWNF
jgi:hypothetical protein